jgi:aspartate kinase
MAELAFAGARVLHSRAVELAALLAVPITVRSSFTSGAGTEIHGWGGEEMLEDRSAVIAVAHDLDVARVLVRCDAGGPDLATAVLQTLADHSVPADLVARAGPHEEEFRMGFTIRRSDVAIIREPLIEVAARRGGGVRIDERVGKVSLIGVGLLNRPDYTARMLTALSDAGIYTSWISTSQVRASAIVPVDRVLDAVTLLHNVFELGSEDVPAGTQVHA